MCVVCSWSLLGNVQFECCALFSSTQLQFTRCSRSLAADNYCSVADPFSISSDGWLTIKVNGSNAVASTTTRDREIQLHDIGLIMCLHFTVM